MPGAITVYTNPLTPGTAQLPVFTVGDDQNWSILFNDGTNFYNPAGVSMNIGFVRGLGNLTFDNGFQWVDRMNNQHIGSFSIAAGVPSAITWDEDPIGVVGGNGAYLIRGRVPPSGTIRKVYVKFGGTGITTAPAVRFNGGATETGQRAIITATVGAGDVTALTIVDGGRGYSATNPPELIITGDGTGSVWKVTTITAGVIVAVTKVTVGSGYTAATVTVRDAEASAEASVGGTSAVSAVRVVNPGSGYTSAPTVGFSGGGGASAAATAALANSTWGLSGLTITGAGSGYLSVPIVSFSGGSGSGAAATAFLLSPTLPVSSIALTGGGSGYTSVPSVSITSTNGSGATATATLTATSIASVAITSTGYWGGSSAITGAASLSFIGGGGSGATGTYSLGVGIIGGFPTGSGYSSAPTVSFTGGGGGSGAAGTANISGGQVVSVTITNPGSGYTSVPNVVFTGGGGSGAGGFAYLAVVSVALTGAGSGYTSVPTVYLDNLYAASGGPAVITASLTATSIGALTLNSGGTNYDTPITVSFSGGGGSGATATGASGSGIGLNLTSPGSGYGATAPTVTIAAPSGGGVTATATAQLIGSPISPVITMTNNGSGYTSPPLVAFTSGGGTGATGVSVVSLGITAITITEGGYAYTSLPAVSILPDNGAVLIAAGVESHSVPFLQNFVPATAQGAITATPYTNGRRNASGDLIYDDSLLIIRPRYLVQPTLTLQGDGLTWAGVFNPVTGMVQAVLNYRRSFVADVEIFGGGRLLFTGAITIAAA